LILESFFQRLKKKKKEQQGNRTIIIHNHLFKNAGSTIDWSLKRNFGNKGFIDHRNDKAMRQGADYLEEYLCKNKNVKALSTHHLVLPLPKPTNIALLMLMMFRHPIERVRSVYNFERKQVQARTPGAIHARKYSLQQYIEWRLRDDVPETIRNYHTTKCLPGKQKLSIGSEIRESDFEKALSTVRLTQMIGLVEHFDESIVVFEEYLKHYFPEIDLSYRIQNVGQPTNIPQSERIDTLRKNIGEEMYSALLQKNNWDLKLDFFVRKEFSKRKSKIENFPQKLHEFQIRCQKHLT
jgi:hypothetical protein